MSFNLSGTLRRSLENLVEKSSRAKIERHPVINKLLKKYKERSPSTGCSYTDYFALYRYIRRHKPREVLECGTGFSTVIIAQALKENELDYGIQGHLVSMEEDAAYFQSALNSLPDEIKNSKRVKIVLSPAVEDAYEIFNGVRYTNIPKRNYDFVFIDGPNYIEPRPQYLLPYNLDFLRLVEKSSQPISAFVDTRRDTSYMYSLLFQDKFAYDIIRGIGIISSVTKNDLTHDLIKGKHLVARSLKGRFMKHPNIIKMLIGNH
jgi:predicted O-methyltransferase YrrM